MILKQDCHDLLAKDKFLKGPGGQLFGNAILHKHLAAHGLINVPAPAPKVAFVIARIVEMLGERAPGSTRSSFLLPPALGAGLSRSKGPPCTTTPPKPLVTPRNANEQSVAVYRAVAALVIANPGRHFAIHDNDSGKDPVRTTLDIFVPPEVWVAAKWHASYTFTLLAGQSCTPANGARASEPLFFRRISKCSCSS